MDPEIEQQEDVTVFWDFSSTQNSSAAATISTSALVKNIYSAVTPYGPLKSIQLYWDHAGYPIQPAATRIRGELSASGVCLIDCPSEGRKEGAMKKMLVDLIIHAWDHEARPHTYVVITSDRDIAYALSRLRMKEYRIILLSPAVAHSDLTSQATIQLDWTKSILGLTSPSNPNIGHIPATTSTPSSSAGAHQQNLSQLRGATLSGFYQESGEPPLPNPYAPPGRQTSSPFFPNKTRIHDDIDNGLGPGPALPQTPPRASTWSTAGDPQIPSATVQVNPISSNSMPSGRTAVGFNGMSGVSFGRPLNTQDNPRPTEITFDPFNDPDEWPRPSFTEGHNSRTRLESATPSSESTSSSATTFSFINPEPASTAPTSAEDECKPAHLKPQSIASDTGDLGKTSGNVAIPASAGIEKAVQSDARPIQTASLPTPLVNAPLPTTTPASTVTAATIPSNPFRTPQTRTSVNAPVSPLVAQMWKPLINTLRENGGMLSFAALPPKLLKSHPKPYLLAGRTKYKPYIQLAVESGIVVERIEDDPTCPSIRLTAAYM